MNHRSKHCYHKSFVIISIIGYWADILGLGDYYFQLAVIIAQISLQTRASNGGILPIADILKRLKNSPESKSLHNVSEEDIKRAVSKLSILGNGFRIIEVLTIFKF